MITTYANGGMVNAPPRNPVSQFRFLIYFTSLKPFSDQTGDTDKPSLKVAIRNSSFSFHHNSYFTVLLSLRPNPFSFIFFIFFIFYFCIFFIFLFLLTP